MALQGDRGPSGSRGLKVDSVGKGPVGSRGPTGKLGVEGQLLERLVKWDLLVVKVKLEHVGKKVTREILMVLVNKDLSVHEVVQVQGVQGVKGLRVVAGIQGPLGVQGPVGTTGV